MTIAFLHLLNRRHGACLPCEARASCPAVDSIDPSTACPLGRWPTAEAFDPRTGDDPGPRPRETPGTPPAPSRFGDPPPAYRPAEFAAWCLRVASETGTEHAEAARACPHRVEVAGCCGGTEVRCEGGARAGEVLRSLAVCVACVDERQGWSPPGVPRASDRFDRKQVEMRD